MKRFKNDRDRFSCNKETDPDNLFYTDFAGDYSGSRLVRQSSPRSRVEVL